MSNCSESLLACSIPDLNFNFMIFQRNSFGGKLNANGWFGLNAKLIFLESGQQVRLTHSRVYDKL